MKLYDVTTVIRSKNAGPFTLTIDIFFDSHEKYENVLASPEFTADQISSLYHVSVSTVQIFPFQAINAIKITLPRPSASSGAPNDNDVYGCQQHFPLGSLELL